MNKKAVSMAFIVVVILVLLLTFIFLFFSKTMFQKTEQLIPEEKCKTTVEREAGLNRILKLKSKRLAGEEGITLQDFARNIECVQIPLNIPGKDEQTLASTTALFMEKCWKTFGAGKTELFSKGDGTFCHICYLITYDSGTSFDLVSALQKRKDFLQGAYDVRQSRVGEHQGVIFRYTKKKQDIERKIFIRALDPAKPQELDVCAGARFPTQRR